ncbi:hypothetical protein A1D29_09915 [Pasteurellaceae bacterium Orientalotternb1]|nr:hypothetical protein A1D29_09915 [Pasteurellaceae bacterium Orientalotternb1]
MRKYLFILLLYKNCLADPFYADNTMYNEQSTFAKNLPNLTACKPPNDLELVYFPIKFEDLKLVGIVKKDQTYTALFSDKENNLIDIKQNSLLVESQIQVEKIDMKNIQIIDWSNSEICSKPKRIQRKL